MKKIKDKVKTIQKKFFIVGLGASAGGLQAFESFFSSIKNNIHMNMAFVVVQHLSPNHTSMLTELIQRFTSMHVQEVRDGVKVETNSVYIIPPNRDMALMNGNLLLLEPSEPRGRRFPIDFFFRSLAQDQRENAIGIILSGTGSDGTQGIRAIKAEGGIVIAQEPKSCEYDGMPSSAIATGLVDFKLEPSVIPAKLVSYATHKLHAIAPEESVEIPSSEDQLKKIFMLLRYQTGHDFANYKRSTINRRIERRMLLHQISTLEMYIDYLQQQPSEVEALFHEFLIGVTSFFRDPDAFKALEDTVSKLFVHKRFGDSIRVWSTGCSTGEEAYSLAILLFEQMHLLDKNCNIQIFATDIDPSAIATARAGCYPTDISVDVSPKRLMKFFTAEPDGITYRINKNIRDMIIFSEQNIIKDPPFSKLDLVSCRNLLIYLDSQLQKKLIPLFHYALNPDGVLFLGSSESIGEFTNLFTPVDNKWKIFHKNESAKNIQYSTVLRPSYHTPTAHVWSPQKTEKVEGSVRLPLRELTEHALLSTLVQAAILVDEKGDILYIYGQAGKYLEVQSGEVCVYNVLKMAHKGLHRSLIIALHKATETKNTVKSSADLVLTDISSVTVHLSIVPVDTSSFTKSQFTLYLIIFEETPSAEVKPSKQSALAEDIQTNETNAYIASLTKELLAQEEFLKTSNEKLLISNQELTSSNEEIQSMNEELQSTNEELETSKEELQSVNEEISTINAELQVKVIDLARSNNDMNNLLAGTGIGTIFVDHNLCIMRFTPAVTKIINLILSDLGRPVGHIVSNLIGYEKLKEDVQAVLDTLVPKEIEVQAKDGSWYVMRIQPYRTLENVIEGAVITFVNITQNIQMREALMQANRELLRMAVIVSDSHDAITVQGLDGHILAWNPAAVRMYGWSESEALAMNIEDRIPKEEQKEALMKIDKLSELEILEPYTARRLTKKGDVVNIWITATALLGKDGMMYAIATTEREVKSLDKSVR